MNVETLLVDDQGLREDALAVAAAAPEHERSAFATKLANVTRDLAVALAGADQIGASTTAHATRFSRACMALANLRVEIAKNSLLRIADEGNAVVKAALASALHRTTTAEGRAVLVYLLSDDEARTDAIVAIGAGPWPEVLPALIEVAEADDNSARAAASAIARCGIVSGGDEVYAAADFLYEQLDDDAILLATVDALLRVGRHLPGLAQRAQRLAKEPGRRKVAGLCLYALSANEGTAALLELAMCGEKADAEAARTFLAPLLEDEDEDVRVAAERTWKVLDLR